MSENPTVHRHVRIRRSSTTVMDSGMATIVEKFEARVYSRKERKNIPVEATSLEEIEQKIDAILDA